ncbi:hypothetical protein [Aquitalea pelogenes]|uniref:hypothetical protein n=1 Tax=Aquitalea pelogenes TaxID=1293573 RepID=UPI000788E7B4|nr:hypothetical protein [Aquitalea pelogenes]
MHRLIDDLLGLLRFRVGPLEQYQYPRWMPALLLTVLGLVASGGTGELGNNVLGRMLFMLMFTWLETLLFTQFITVWLRLAKWRPDGSLFGLIVLCNSLQFVEPLTSWLPDDAALGADLALSLLTIALMVNSMAVVSGVARVRVLLGVMLFAPVAMLTLAISLQMASSMGWVTIPQDMLSAVGEVSTPADTAPAGGKGSSDL